MTNLYKKTILKAGLLSLAFLSLASSTLLAQESLIINAYNRDTQSLNGNWSYIIDPYENGFYDYRYRPFENRESPGNGAFFINAKPKNPSDLIEYNFEKSDSIMVPGDWNTQKEKLFYYEGTIWYKKSFDYTRNKNSNRVFIYFEASNYHSDVYFNGTKLGVHVGGFTPFNFEITDLLTEKENFIVVKVDNKRKREGVPTLNTDWWNYGGLTRGVKLIETSENFIQDYFIQLDPNDKTKIKGSIKLNGKNISQRSVQVILPELKINKKVITNERGVASFEINPKKIQYWTGENPHLYVVTLQMEEDQVTDQIGFRTIETSGRSILVNGKKVFLKGISIHEESPIREGRGHTEEDARQLLGWAKELGCNYVRLAHYPHNEHMVRLADEMGMFVWEEIPVYWTISWENEATYLNAENQFTEVFSRDKNRASVIIWSIANETPAVEDRTLFLTRLANHVRALDPTRLISAAMEQSDYKENPTIRTINDPLVDQVDILSFNQYIGWYDGLPEKCRTIRWIIEQDKPVLISEFGGGAKQGLHGDKNTLWTEEFQENLYVETLSMIEKIDQLQGFSPWVLVDFRSPRRILPEIQDGWNRKGLLSEDGKKKKAFFVLKEYYENKKVSK